MRRPTHALLAVALVGALTACSPASGDDTTPGKKILVATTVSPLTSIASSIGGDDVRVEGIVPEGTNSHTFEPAPSVASLLSDADLIVVNGLRLEQPTVELAETVKKSSTAILSLGDQVLTPDEYVYDFSFPRDGGKPNPHAWTDPVLAREYARVITDAFSHLDPTREAAFRSRLSAFEQEADALSEALLVDQRTVPDGIRLLTYHDSFAYLGQRLGWQIVGAIQPEDFQEPTAAEVARIIDQVRKQDVPAVFGSEVFPSPVLEQIAAETGATYIDDLRDDDLPGAPGDPEHSWAAMMRFNFATIVSGLGGQPTALGALALTAPVESARYPQ